MNDWQGKQKVYMISLKGSNIYDKIISTSSYIAQFSAWVEAFHLITCDDSCARTPEESRHHKFAASNQTIVREMTKAYEFCHVIDAVAAPAKESFLTNLSTSIRILTLS